MAHNKQQYEEEIKSILLTRGSAPINQIDGALDTSEEDSEEETNIKHLDSSDENNFSESSYEMDENELSKDNISNESYLSTDEAEQSNTTKKRKTMKNKEDVDASNKKFTETSDMSAYFKSTEEIEAKIKNGPLNISSYLGNLRKTGGFNVLKNGYISMLDCDYTNNLKPLKANNMVFVKALPCKKETGVNCHVFVCLECNSKIKTNAIISTSGPQQIISNRFIESNLKMCKHTAVAEALYTIEEARQTEMVEYKCQVVVNTTKQHMAICFDGKTHGVVVVNLAKGGNKGKCCLCRSIKCDHIKEWNTEQKKDVMKETFTENNINTENITEKDTKEDQWGRTMKLKLPLSEQTQQLMQRADDQEYDKIEHFFNDHIEGTSCLLHQNSWDSRCPIQNDWWYANKVKIAHSKYVKPKPRKVYYRPTTGECDCRLPYNGEDDMLLDMGGKHTTRQRNGTQSVSTLVSLSLLFDFSIDFFETGQTMRGFHRSYRAKCLLKYGMDAEDIVSWRKWREACNIFWKDIFVMDLKETYKCDNCGPRPHTLVVDGIAMGIQTKQLKKYMQNMKTAAPYSSPSILKGSAFRDRMFVKKQSNRNILREAAKNCIWPKKERQEEDDPDYRIGNKRKNAEPDTGMSLVWNCLQKIDQTNPPRSGMIDLLMNLSTKTSTTSLFQVVDLELLGQLECYLVGSTSHNFVRGTRNIEMHQNMKSKYPVVTSIINNLANEAGQLEKPVSDILLALVKHTLSVYNSSLQRSTNSYTKRSTGELDTQIFPNFPILRERAKYNKTCTQEDKRAWEKLCEKTFPSHKKLTPGLFLVTCACAKKVVYGFSMMLSGESPEMLFDIIMTRFEEDYNPNIIYDASCKLKEFGLNRELRRFMNIQIMTDRFHECNHTACSDSFKSSIYDCNQKINSEAAEQTNSVLRRVGNSTTYMNPQLFMKTISYFMGYQNIIAKS